MSKKKTVSMGTKQYPVPENPNKNTMALFYDNFKNRVKKKSDHAYHDRDEEPVLLRVYFIGSIFNSTQEILVVHKSFELKLNDNKEEIGFTALVRTFDDAYYKLTVYNKRFKAHMAKTKKK